MCERQDIQDKVTDLFFEELSTEEAEAVRVHVDGCDECRAIYEDLKEAVSCLQPLVSDPDGVCLRLTDDRRGAILTAARELDAESRSPEPIAMARFPFMRVAALLLVTFGTAIFLVWHGQKRPQDVALTKPPDPPPANLHPKSADQNAGPQTPAPGEDAADRGGAPVFKGNKLPGGDESLRDEEKPTLLHFRDEGVATISDGKTEKESKKGEALRNAANRPGGIITGKRRSDLEADIDPDWVEGLPKPVKESLVKKDEIADETEDALLDSITKDVEKLRKLSEETKQKEASGAREAMRRSVVGSVGNRKSARRQAAKNQVVVYGLLNRAPTVEKSMKKSKPRTTADGDLLTLPLTAKKGISRQTRHGAITYQRPELAAVRFSLGIEKQQTFKRVVAKVAQLEGRAAPKLRIEGAEITLEGAAQDIVAADQMLSLFKHTKTTTLSKAILPPAAKAGGWTGGARAKRKRGPETPQALPTHRALPDTLDMGLVTFSSALSRLSEATGLKIDNRTALKNEVLKITLSRTTAASALSLICDALHVHYEVRDGAVVVLPGPGPNSSRTVLHRLTDAQFKKLKLTRGAATDNSILQALLNQGVVFGHTPGIAYDRASGIFVVHATPAELAQISKILAN